VYNAHPDECGNYDADLGVISASCCVCGAFPAGAVFYLHDDPSLNDMPDTPADIAPGFTNDNAMYVGNYRVAQMPITGLKMCLAEKATGIELCYDVTDTDFTWTGDVPTEFTNPFQKVIFALSGQVPVGSSGSGNFIETKLSGPASNPGGAYCPGMIASSSPMYCWNCLSWPDDGRGAQITQVAGYGAWHLWGYGWDLYPWGHPDNPTRELAMLNECNGDTGPWDTFYMVAS